MSHSKIWFFFRPNKLMVKLNRIRKRWLPDDRTITIAIRSTPQHSPSSNRNQSRFETKNFVWSLVYLFSCLICFCLIWLDSVWLSIRWFNHWRKAIDSFFTLRLDSMPFSIIEVARFSYIIISLVSSLKNR